MHSLLRDVIVTNFAPMALILDSVSAKRPYFTGGSLKRDANFDFKTALWDHKHWGPRTPDHPDTSMS
jgi:hypothetical protein